MTAFRYKAKIADDIYKYKLAVKTKLAGKYTTFPTDYIKLPFERPKVQVALTLAPSLMSWTTVADWPKVKLQF